MTLKISWIIDVDRFGGASACKGVEYISSAYLSLPKGERPEKVIVNSTGIGASVADALLGKGLPVFVTENRSESCLRLA